MLKLFIFCLVHIQLFQIMYACTPGYVSTFSYNVFCPGIAKGFYRKKVDCDYAGVRLTQIYKMIERDRCPLVIRLIYNKENNKPWKLVSLINDNDEQKIIESNYIEEIPLLNPESRSFFSLPQVILKNTIEPRPFTCMYSYETQEFIEEIILYINDYQDKNPTNRAMPSQVGEQCFEFTATTTGRYIFNLMNEVPWNVVFRLEPPHIYRIIIDVAGNCSGCMALGIDSFLLESIPNSEWAYFQVYY